jgi:hypothetical protein
MAEEVTVYEDGLAGLTPFLGREFRGQRGLQEYLIIACWSEMILSWLRTRRYLAGKGQCRRVNP